MSLHGVVWIVLVVWLTSPIWIIGLGIYLLRRENRRDEPDIWTNRERRRAAIDAWREQREREGSE